MSTHPSERTYASGPAEPLDLDAIEREWLQLCGPCDAGTLDECTCPPGDHRPIIGRLVHEVRRQRDAAHRSPLVAGRCPACGWESLALADGGHVTCRRLECTAPEAVDDVLHGEREQPVLEDGLCRRVWAAAYRSVAEGLQAMRDDRRPVAGPAAPTTADGAPVVWRLVADLTVDLDTDTRSRLVDALADAVLDADPAADVYAGTPSPSPATDPGRAAAPAVLSTGASAAAGPPPATPEAHNDAEDVPGADQPCTDPDCGCCYPFGVHPVAALSPAAGRVVDAARRWRSMHSRPWATAADPELAAAVDALDADQPVANLAAVSRGLATDSAGEPLLEWERELLESGDCGYGQPPCNRTPGHPGPHYRLPREPAESTGMAGLYQRLREPKSCPTCSPPSRVTYAAGGGFRSTAVDPEPGSEPDSGPGWHRDGIEDAKGRLPGDLAAQVDALLADRDGLDDVVDAYRLGYGGLRDRASTLVRERDTARAELATARATLARFAGSDDQVRAELAKAIEERDLAIAHDRQPYPTADAYEQACKALEKHRQRADKAETELVEVRADMTWLRQRYARCGEALCTDIERDRDRLREWNDDGRRALADANGSIAALRGELDQVDAVLSRHGIEHPRGAQGVLDLAGQASDRADELATVTADRDRIRGERDNLETQIRSYLRLLDAIAEAAPGATNPVLAVHRMRQEANAHEGELGDMRARLSAADTEVDRLRDEAAEADRERARWTSDAAAWERRADELAAELATARRDAAADALLDNAAVIDAAGVLSREEATAHMRRTAAEIHAGAGPTPGSTPSAETERHCRSCGMRLGFGYGASGDLCSTCFAPDPTEATDG